MTGANSNDVLIALLTVATPLVTTLGILLKKKYNKKKKEDEFKLCKHSFFTKSQSIKNHILYNFSLQNKGKEIVFKEILEKNIDIKVDLLKKLCEEIDCNKINTNEELLEKHLELYQKSIDDFSVYYIYNNSYNEKEKKVLKKVIDKFNKWNYIRIEQTPQMLQSVCSSAFYVDIKTKAAVILDIYTTEIINSIQDAEMTLNELNGDLRGLNFRGNVL